MAICAESNRQVTHSRGNEAALCQMALIHKDVIPWESLPLPFRIQNSQRAFGRSQLLALLDEKVKYTPGFFAHQQQLCPEGGLVFQVNGPVV
ncbi:hypothetical protein D3C85_1490740 [compost metagenome]